MMTKFFSGLVFRSLISANGTQASTYCLPPQDGQDCDGLFEHKAQDQRSRNSTGSILSGDRAAPTAQ